jgi:hypothetical protein
VDTKTTESEIVFIPRLHAYLRLSSRDGSFLASGQEPLSGWRTFRPARVAAGQTPAARQGLANSGPTLATFGC